MTRTRIDQNCVVVVRPAEQQPATQKPNGLWYEVNGGWREWCRSEEPGWLTGRFLHEVILGEENLLTIRTAPDLDLFHERFAYPLYPGCDFLRYPHWFRVAREYDGIEIAPYLWSRRLGAGEVSRWYYGWDCASGVIWHPRGVRCTLIGPVEGVAP